MIMELQDSIQIALLSYMFDKEQHSNLYGSFVYEEFECTPSISWISR